ncbi:MAG: hypothetical protein V5A41_12140 [Haloarculaceae archaeon]
MGVAGITSMTGLALATERSLGFTETTTIQSVDGVTLSADWRETYNGRVLEDTRITPTESGAVLSLDNLMPGDSGVLSVRLSVQSEDEEESPQVEPRLTFQLTETSEHGLTEPEQTVGDTSAETGELQEFLTAAIWYDTGLASIDAFGANNSVQDLGEQLIRDDAEGTLAAVASAVDDVSLTPAGCLGVDESVTVSLGWSFDEDSAGVDAAQGDSVTFNYLIDSHHCATNE